MKDLNLHVQRAAADLLKVPEGTIVVGTMELELHLGGGGVLRWQSSRTLSPEEVEHVLTRPRVQEQKPIGDQSNG